MVLSATASNFESAFVLETKPNSRARQSPAMCLASIGLGFLFAYHV
jgi:hypothetical protein